MAKMLFSEEKFVDICLNISRRMEKLRFSSDKMDRILCSDYILRSCYNSTSISINESLDHFRTGSYREAGLYCYWIIKRKPFSLSNINSKNSSNIQLNELLGYYIAVTTVDYSQSRALDQIKGESGLKKAQEIQNLRDKNYDRSIGIEGRIIQNLRDHDFSASSISVLLEAQFGIPLEENFPSSAA